MTIHGKECECLRILMPTKYRFETTIWKPDGAGQSHSDVFGQISGGGLSLELFYQLIQTVGQLDQFIAGRVGLFGVQGCTVR